jgi:trehalose 6-phosphate phosphatase
MNLAVFFEEIARAPERVLMLDYDGTLAPFHVDPSQAVPYPEVAAVLEEIGTAGGTRIVIISGRPADEVPPLLSLSWQPEIWGSHGWERLLPDGSRTVTQAAPHAARALEAGVAAVADLMRDGARLERKLASIALHWRGLPPAAAAELRRRAASAWAPLAPTGRVELLAFDGGLELRAVGCSKQSAVEAVLSESAPDSAVAYLGDDMTDEDAFRALKRRGVGVLVRTELRETAADVWLKPPHELVAFLRHWSVPKPK